MLQSRTSFWVESGQLKMTFGKSWPEVPIGDLAEVALSSLPASIVIFLATTLVMYVTFVHWFKWGRTFWNIVEVIWILIAATSIASAVQQVAKFNREAQIGIIERVASDEMRAAYREIPIDYDRCLGRSAGESSPLCSLLAAISRDTDFLQRKLTWQTFDQRYGKEFRSQIAECNRAKDQCQLGDRIDDYKVLMTASATIASIAASDSEIFSRSFTLIWPSLFALAFGLRLSRAIAAFYGRT